MGRHRTISDDATYAKNRAYYEKHLEHIKARCRQQYQDGKEFNLACWTAIRHAKKVLRGLGKEKLQEAIVVIVEQEFQKAGGDLVRLYERAQSSHRNSQFIRAYKTINNKCVDCQQTYPYYVLDFDPVRGKKLVAVSKMATKSYSQGLLEAEIAKCDIVCANCHRVRTFKNM